MGTHEMLFLAAFDMVYAGIIGLVFILLVVFCIMARKTWGWVDITFVILSFIAGTAAIWGASQCYKLRYDQLKEVAKWEKQYNENKVKADLQIVGEVTSLSYDPGCLRAVTAELRRELAGRGRVWSQGTLTADGANKVFAFSTARPDVTERPLLNVVGYVFLERKVGNQNYPADYIGSVRIEKESAESVTISPLALAEPGEFASPTGTWTLFEKMPLDRRDSLKSAVKALMRSKGDARSDDENALMANLEDPTADLDITAYRRQLENTFMSPKMVGLDGDSLEYEKLIDNYAFDGLSIGEIQNWIDANSAGRKILQFEPPLEEVFVKYRFDKKSSRTYAVDANGSVENDGLFTPLGLAVDKALHAGKEVSFAAGDTILVDKRTADGYQRSAEVTIPAFATTEAVTPVGEFFIRQVKDFPYEFADLREQSEKMSFESARVTKSNAVQAKSLADARTQEAARDAQTADLEADSEYLKKDFAAIQSLFRDKSDQNSGLKQKIKLLESQIEVKYKELRSLSISLSRQAFAGK